MGFDAAVCESVLSSRAKGFLNRLGMGKLTYLAVALRELLTAHMPSCQVIVAGQPPLMLKHFLFAAGMVHRYEGGGFRFCPEADDRGGLLDVCAVGDLPRLAVLLALPTAFSGSTSCFPACISAGARRSRSPHPSRCASTRTGKCWVLSIPSRWSAAGRP